MFSVCRKTAGVVEFVLARRSEIRGVVVLERVGSSLGCKTFFDMVQGLGVVMGCVEHIWSWWGLLFGGRWESCRS